MTLPVGKKSAAVFAATLLLTGLFASPSIADDHFLTIGGGYSPTGNQVSLEKNVLMFGEILNEVYAEAPQHDILFSDGKRPSRDIQFADPDFEISKARKLVAQVNRQTRYLNLQYRDHKLPNVRAGTSKATIEKWFNEVGSKLTDGDRLFLYVTAHGGRSSDRKKPHNTALYVWNNQKILMSEFASYMDKVPESVPVVVVMVQCYSGGFADLAFEAGDRTKGITNANRCGFFATVHNRVAAGCTPDIDEANYREYSSYFWAALRGKNRIGEPVTGCDYDGDNRVSYREAHAYALLESDTIDISVCTSDAFLRVNSRSKPDNKKGDEGRELLTMETPYAQLLELASPTERAVMEGLSAQLELDGENRIADLKKMADDLAKEVKSTDGAKRKKDGEYSGVCRSMSGSLRLRWPEFSNRWHPEVDRILDEEGEAVAKFLERHPYYKRLQKLAGEAGALARKKLDLDKRWAKTQRLLRTIENVVLAANLPKIADEPIVEQFHRLRDSESQFFGIKQ